MSKLAYTVIAALFTISGQVMASVQSNCSDIDAQGLTSNTANGGSTMCQTIGSVATNLDRFQPPQPCANTSSNLNFVLGSPADVCSSAGSGGGNNSVGGFGTPFTGP